MSETQNDNMGYESEHDETQKLKEQVVIGYSGEKRGVFCPENTVDIPRDKSIRIVNLENQKGRDPGLIT